MFRFAAAPTNFTSLTRSWPALWVRGKGVGKDSVVFWMRERRRVLQLRNTRKHGFIKTTTAAQKKASVMRWPLLRRVAAYFWDSTQATRVLASAGLTWGLGGIGI
jgi:hypothetical protein